MEKDLYLLLSKGPWVGCRQLLLLGKGFKAEGMNIDLKWKRH